MSLSRRELIQGTLGSLLTCSLLDLLRHEELIAAEIRPEITTWLNEVNQQGLDLKGKKLQQLEWQKRVDELFGRVELQALLKYLDFSKLAAEAKPPENGARSLRFAFPEVEGLPRDWSFGRQIFALNKGRSVVPHGHNNMATAFLILQGEFHGRHYDRLQDQPEHFVIRPTIDGKFGPGGHSTVSDLKDNIHWFQAQTDNAFILNIHVLGFDNKNPDPTGRLYLDPMGEKLSDGTIRARRIDHDEAHRLYG